MKKILVTNDDGFESPGLKALVEAVKDLGEVLVVAPALEKSACGHSLTLTRPLRFVEIDDDFYKIDDGTPTDAIYLALHALYADGVRPDLVLSGINRGANMGEDITYSGTANAALEAVLHGIPACAVSQVCNHNCAQVELEVGYALAQRAAREVAIKMLRGEIPLRERSYLNINVPPLPPERCRGFKVTKAGYRYYGNDAHVHRNPRGEEYWWIGLHPLEWRPEAGGEYWSDFDAVKAGFISVTPVTANPTDFEGLPEVSRAF
ncbi:MAG: 5'/3'-nucleotidase SurE [Epsilonproteobacteria bacterium]|nr:5'/3'-nucleotidase SurE [Campylobacterota bacterium]NPA57610.1 5'/3'-nucleotidase SurE [Campylobacterota bacterium]